MPGHVAGPHRQRVIRPHHQHGGADRIKRLQCPVLEPHRSQGGARHPRTQRRRASASASPHPRTSHIVLWHTCVPPCATVCACFFTVDVCTAVGCLHRMGTPLCSPHQATAASGAGTWRGAWNDNPCTRPDRHGPTLLTAASRACAWSRSSRPMSSRCHWSGQLTVAQATPSSWRHPTSSSCRCWLIPCSWCRGPSRTQLGL